MGFLLPKVTVKYEVTKDCKVFISSAHDYIVSSMILRGWPSKYMPEMVINTDGSSFFNGHSIIELDMPAGCIFNISRIHMSQYHKDFTMNITNKDNKHLLSSAKVEDLIKRYYPLLKIDTWRYRYSQGRISLNLNTDSLIALECKEM